MYKYYLFIIKKEVYSAYYNNMDILFSTLRNLYYSSNNELSYGLSVYNQICDIFNKNILKDYFKNKNSKYIKEIKNKFLIKDKNGEISLINIRSSCLIIKTNSKLPVFLKIINYYNKYIFVCDFKNGRYFWLNDQYK